MEHITKLANLDIENEIAGKIACALRAFSVLSGNGSREIKGLDFEHLCHEVIPSEIHKVLKNLKIFKEEN